MIGLSAEQADVRHRDEATEQTRAAQVLPATCRAHLILGHLTGRSRALIYPSKLSYVVRIS